MLREKKDKFQYIKRLNRNSQHPVLLFEEVEGKNEDLRMEKKILTQEGEIVDVAERDEDHVYVATKQHGIHVFTKLGKIYIY